MNNVPEERPSPPALLLYSKPADARVPTAGWCDEASKTLALSVAERLGYSAVAVTNEQADLIKAAVPRADITRRGKVTLSPVKPDVLQRLLANLEGEPVEQPDGSGTLPAGVMPVFVGSSDDTPATGLATDPLWSALAVNMVVLAPEYNDQGAPEGWWEAVILGIRGDTLTLRWRDYPRQSIVRRKRDEVAIMYPPPVRP